MTEVPTPRQVSRVDSSTSDKSSSSRGNWLAGIISVVKSPSKNATGRIQQTQRTCRGDERPVTTCTNTVTSAGARGAKFSESGRSRKDGRPNKSSSNPLRLERRARSSSLDTIFTTLSWSQHPWICGNSHCFACFILLFVAFLSQGIFRCVRKCWSQGMDNSIIALKRWFFQV